MTANADIHGPFSGSGGRPPRQSRRLVAPALLVLALTSSTPANATTDDERQQQWESLLLSIPDPTVLRSNLYDLTRRSHVAGTPGDYEDARYVQDKLNSLPGLEAHMEEVPVMLTYPRTQPSLVAPAIGYKAKLSEEIVDGDDTSDTHWRNHTFNAYSPSGTVTAPLVYANYGRPQDFDALHSLGVNVTGKIVLMRYGECFRGLKVMNAEAKGRGAAASIIYSDPQQDGYTQGPVYPTGPWRPPSGVQRGSVQFNTRCAGDPFRLYSSSNEGDDESESVEDICGYKTEDLIPKRPVLPISYEDAAPLLAKLGGPAAPDDFRGGLDLEYTVGPSEFDVTLQTDNKFRPGTIPNVIATLEGTDPSAGSIILGNHRDAWVFGAVDPNSGTAALLEVARALSALSERGWRPRRTVVFASWSGEEYGLLGSTAFAEMHDGNDGKGDVVVRDAVAYLNVDIAVAGNQTLTASATHSLDRLFREAATSVPAPNAPAGSGRTMADVFGTDGHGEVGTLGSGSDYTAFLDRYGVASLDMTFSGSYGVYHSVYDSFHWMATQADPNFEVHRAMTRLWSVLAFRLASDQVLPFYMTGQARVLRRYVDGLSDAASVAGVDLTPLEASVSAFRRAAEDIDNESRDAAAAAQPNLRGGAEEEAEVEVDSDRRHRDDINRRLAYAERRFLGPGLPRRPWFRHVLQAPGYYLGYGSRPFPGIAEALDWHDADLARSEVGVAAVAVANAAAFLRVEGESAYGGATLG